MNRRDYDKERAFASVNPVKYCRDRQIFRLDEGLPESLQAGWCNFWLFGVWPGSFLSAVIRNDLMGAFAQADLGNRARLFEICSWFWNYGDNRALKERAEDWSRRGGYFGQLRKEVQEDA